MSAASASTTEVLPQELKGSLWKSMDRFFFTVLLASLFLHFTGAACLVLMPKPPPREVPLEEVLDRFARLSLPSVTAVAKPTAQVAVEKKSATDASTGAKSKVQTAAGTTSTQATRELVQARGLLKILGSKGNGGGALADVLGDGSAAKDIGEALSGAKGVGLATTEAIGSAGQKGGGTGKVAGIGQVGTKGGGDVDLGTKGDVAVRGEVKDSAPILDDASINSDELARFLRQRKMAIQSCYEKELKRNPTLRGRIVVRFVITPQGRAQEIDIEENTLGNEGVAACIRNVVRSWTFPFSPSGGVTVAYPFVFAPAG
jgi:hypothetical protein